MKISLNTAEAVISILDGCSKGEKTRTSWECNNEYDRQEMMKHRSHLLAAVSYLSKFSMPESFRQEVKRIFQKCKEDHWTLPVPKLYPPKNIVSGGEKEPESIDTIQANLMKDIRTNVCGGDWVRIILAVRLQEAGMLRFTNIGEKFHSFWKSP